MQCRGELAGKDIFWWEGDTHGRDAHGRAFGERSFVARYAASDASQSQDPDGTHPFVHARMHEASPDIHSV